jgi:(R)-2-hydroxyacyl-CoA dehydratese activating ATPase
MNAGLCCGVDVGAAATKLVLWDAAARQVRARVVRRSGVDYRATVQACLDEALAAAGAPSVLAAAVSTGYGRESVPFAAATRTEIHCQTVGCAPDPPRALTVVDIGGQDTKVLHLDGGGRRQSFKMNRKCAAGTGAFLEEIALRLELELDELHRQARLAETEVTLSSFCTVFAKTEILAHLRRGAPLAAIARGAYRAVVQRVLEMDALDGEVLLTGGVAAYHELVAELLGASLGRDVVVPPFAQFTAALGAARLAAGER